MRKIERFCFLVLVSFLFLSLTNCAVCSGSENLENVSGSSSVTEKPVECVDPFIGTGNNGHIFPGACRPFGMVQLSPDTGGLIGNWLSSAWKWCAGYHYTDDSILGFSHLHRSGMGVGDWGDVLMMPTTGELRVNPGPRGNTDEGYRSRFSHEEEEAEPGYFTVGLMDYGIKAELTTTRRVGFHRYTFPKADNAHILVDLSHGLGDTSLEGKIKIRGENTICGYRVSTGRIPYQIVYFWAEFSRSFGSFGVWKGNSEIKYGRRAVKAPEVGAFVNYSTFENENIKVKVGISYTSIDQARLNLRTELSSWDFDSVRENSEKLWNEQLSQVEVRMDSTTGENYVENQKNKFYTGLYHCSLFPSVFSDVDGKYTVIGNSPDKVNTAENFTYYSDFSTWDTFRAEMPLLFLLKPDRARDMIKTMITQYEDTGWLPTPQQFGNYHADGMIGDHPTAVITDAYLKGITNFDEEKAYEGMRKNATKNGLDVLPGTGFGVGRYKLGQYKSLGYVPGDFKLPHENPLFIISRLYNQGTSRTLAYAYDDFCLAQMAKKLDKTEDYRYFLQRAHNYINVFDTETGFVRGRGLTGHWLDKNSFDPMKIYSYYTEGNAWQWTWFVPHDVQGLITLMGGREKFTQKLDNLFNQPSSAEDSPNLSGMIGQYAHGNEPSHHITYLYNYAGQPWKTQKWTRQIMENLYGTGPAGICGNEDMGQLSAWYVFSAMGLYPSCPGMPVYTLGSPLFDNIVIHLDNGKKFIIKARNVSQENKYIQSAKLNGKTLNKTWITHSNLVNGDNLILEMGPKPNKNWGTKLWDAPPSMTGFYITSHMLKEKIS